MTTPQTMTEKDAYLATAEREHQTTMKLLRAYPADKAEMRPHPTSGSAAEVAWVLARGRMVAQKLAQGEDIVPKPGAPRPEAPKSWPEILTALESAHRDAIAAAKTLGESQFNETTRVPVGPQKIGEVRRGDALWMFLYDGIHHRGQLSVYLRMTGSKVPSIYGPSKDEPWF